MDRLLDRVPGVRTIAAMGLVALTLASPFIADWVLKQGANVNGGHLSFSPRISAPLVGACTFHLYNRTLPPKDNFVQGSKYIALCSLFGYSVEAESIHILGANGKSESHTDWWAGRENYKTQY